MSEGDVYHFQAWPLKPLMEPSILSFLIRQQNTKALEDFMAPGLGFQKEGAQITPQWTCAEVGRVAEYATLAGGLFWAEGKWEEAVQNKLSGFPPSTWKQNINAPCEGVLLPLNSCTRRRVTTLISGDEQALRKSLHKPYKLDLIYYPYAQLFAFPQFGALRISVLFLCVVSSPQNYCSLLRCYISKC